MIIEKIKKKKSQTGSKGSKVSEDGEMKVFWNGQKSFLWSEEGHVGLGLSQGRVSPPVCEGETQWAETWGLAWTRLLWGQERPPPWMVGHVLERGGGDRNQMLERQVVCDFDSAGSAWDFSAQGRVVTRVGVVVGLEGVTGAHPSTPMPHSPLGFNFTLISTQFFYLKTPNDEPAWSLYKAVVLKLECASPPSGILFWMRIPGTCPPAHTQVLIP